MKRTLLTIAFCILLGGGVVEAREILNLTAGYIDPHASMPGMGRTPAKAPTIWQDGYTLTFPSSHPEYALDIIQNGVVVYSAIVEEDATSITLPSWLSGEYELQLLPEDSNYYYIGYITL